MASPQLKHGHTRIANEILEQIMKTNLNGSQFRLVLAIWRYTYGFQRKQHEMSISFLAKLIDASRSQVDRELTTLIERNVITIVETGSKGARVLTFNKNYKEWSDKGPNDAPTPFPLKKEDNPKKKAPTKKLKYEEDNTYYKMAVYFHSRITAVAKDAGVEHLIKRANLQSYADEFRKLIELDGVNKKQAKEVMDWVTQDSFWKTNILSAKKLRNKFAELAIKMKAQQQPKQPKQTQLPDHRDKDIAFQQWIQQGNDPDAFDWGS